MLKVTYNNSLFKSQTVQELLINAQMIINAIAENKRLKVQDIPLDGNQDNSSKYQETLSESYDFEF